MRPDGRPQHEWTPPRAHPEVGRRQHRAARHRGDRGLVASTERERRTWAVEPSRREGSGSQLRVEIAEPGGHIARARAEAQQLDSIALGKQRVERDAVRRQDIRHERNRHGCAACQNRRLVASPGNTPARVLLLHNRYRAAGGEERVIDELAALLAARGHAVARCERDSEGAGSVQAARGLWHGGLDPQSVADAVRAHRADVVHAHNLHPLLGWRALAAARAAGARTVLHLHNYRLVCAIGVAYRDGEPCHACHGRDTRPGVRHGCRGSLGEAVVYAAGLARQQPQLLAQADALVAVSGAHAARLAGFGIPRERMSVLYNGVRAIGETTYAAAGTYALVASRLVEEKGVETALRAASAAGVPLRVAGTGPDEPRLRALAAELGGDVRFLGQLDAEGVAHERRGAALLLAPSRCEEPCPMSVVEALADGLPVLVSDRGGLPELAGAGAALPAGDISAWVAALRELWEQPALRATRGVEALVRARERHAPDVVYAGLQRIYGQPARSRDAVA